MTIDLKGRIALVTGAAKGIAITGVNTAKGQLYYSLDGGTNWTELTDATLSTARLLKADADHRIYFRPAAGTLGDVSDAITFRAWDQSNSGSVASGRYTEVPGVTGGTTAYSTATATASITVTAVNATATPVERKVSK